MICYYCKNRDNDGNIFCENCGNRMSSVLSHKEAQAKMQNDYKVNCWNWIMEACGYEKMEENMYRKNFTDYLIMISYHGKHHTIGIWAGSKFNHHFKGEFDTVEEIEIKCSQIYNAISNLE